MDNDVLTDNAFATPAIIFPPLMVVVFAAALLPASEMGEIAATCLGE